MPLLQLRNNRYFRGFKYSKNPAFPFFEGFEDRNDTLIIQRIFTYMRHPLLECTPIRSK
jgi:hypothetical protein